MLDYVYGQDEVVAHAVAQMIPAVRERGFGKCKAIGVIDGDGRLLAGIVYHNWSPEAGVIEISMAALPKTKWLTRETLHRMFEYPFDQIGVQMIMHVVPADDERSLRQIAVAGHMFIKVPRLLGRDRDAVLCLLTREAWDASKFKRPAIERMKEAA
jgi:RimJ/RimL family protein N-acetyltransferase